MTVMKKRFCEYPDFNHPLYRFMRGKILATSSGTATIGVTDLIGYRKTRKTQNVPPLEPSKIYG